MNLLVLDAYSDRPIAFNRHYVTIGCGITGALMLSQAVYWSKRTKDKDGWFYKTQAEWELETGLTRREQDTARSRLESLGVLYVERRGIPAQLFYKVDVMQIHNLLINAVDLQSEAMHKSAKLGAHISQSTNTETTASILSGNPDDGSFKDQCKQVLEYLNEKAGTRYRMAESNTRAITARLKEGASVEEMKQVIDLKCSSWLHDNKMKKYLRPLTLFNASKYNNYIGELTTEFEPSRDSSGDDFMMGI